VEEIADEEDGRSFRRTEWDARPDGQLASLFRLQLTPDDICGNRTCYTWLREGDTSVFCATLKKKIEDDYVSGRAYIYSSEIF